MEGGRLHHYWHGAWPMEPGEQGAVSQSLTRVARHQFPPTWPPPAGAARAVPLWSPDDGIWVIPSPAGQLLSLPRFYPGPVAPVFPGSPAQECAAGC